MKRHTFVVLLISAAFTLTAFAQQTGSNSGATSAAQAAPAPQSVDTDSVREPLQPVKSTDFWDGDQPNVMNLIFHPFATKAYVKRQTQPIDDRLNELNEVTAADALKNKDIDARSQQGLQLSSEKANLADQHAADAVNRAQVAQTAATQASGRVSSDEKVVGNLDQYKGETQTEIHFRAGQTVLSKQAKEALDRMAVPLKDQHNYIIEVRSFAPGGGHAAIAASKNMADSVVRYLVLNHKIPVYRIYTVGMGSAPVAAEGSASKRVSGGRVEVNLLKNDLVSSAQR